MRIPKRGELRARWAKGRTHGRNYDLLGDLMYGWGEGCSKSDGALIHYTFTQPLSATDKKSFVEDLIARGYDITTLKFSIQKLPPVPPVDAEPPR